MPLRNRSSAMREELLVLVLRCTRIISPEDISKSVIDGDQYLSLIVRGVFCFLSWRAMMDVLVASERWWSGRRLPFLSLCSEGCFSSRWAYANQMLVFPYG